jgi:hypothetical protein
MPARAGGRAEVARTGVLTVGCAGGRKSRVLEYSSGVGIHARIQTHTAAVRHGAMAARWASVLTEKERLDEREPPGRERLEDVGHVRQHVHDLYHLRHRCRLSTREYRSCYA